MNDDTSLNRVLGKRKVYPPSSNLSERIIAAAAVKKDVPLWVIILQEFSAMFILSRPAYAMAFMLLFGIFLGLQGEVEQMYLAQDWLSFMSIDSDLTMENW